MLAMKLGAIGHFRVTAREEPYKKLNVFFFSLTDITTAGILQHIVSIFITFDRYRRPFEVVTSIYVRIYFICLTKHDVGRRHRARDSPYVSPG